ncbi:hypothetical protein ASPZODRAFT_137484 [Penicilliopsis zonata CBS 506.65]|uniref:Uncharacterized protein n=1 Tax=Penicilliopsis zonata CBS 506.65 TaxID=1073090 RepID=A0A1L9S4M7_9EURO|nr:hypothetical protein ASPZODRAFT_137484 [Penicilliopsis zonata CBS 506.65]OJJ42094.1 hypothetical protein ASPZODRAFT_137484 [Penicilliopsis zonata CBS 506.65]
MGWFPRSIDSEANQWQFDIVGLLAVIGGSALEKHLPAITASPFSAFPRLLPAPESLLSTERSHRLPAVKNIRVVGIQSGNLVGELNYFADLIHNVESLPSFMVKVCHIRHHRDVEGQDKPGQQGDSGRPIRIQPFCWLNIVTWLSVLILAGLLVAAGVLHDGVALLALATMSCSTSAASLSALWSPSLAQRTASNQVPPANVVLVTRGGAFVVVNCDEYVCRELYTGKDDCSYRYNRTGHRSLLATSTLLLMAAVILFGSCTWRMQIAVGSAYIVLNAMYWLLALLVEPRDIWDLTRYEVEEESSTRATNFTQALWLAIHHAGDTKWVRRADAAPISDAWDQWLAEAKRNVHNIDWDAVGCKDRLMRAAVEEHKSTVALLR